MVRKKVSLLFGSKITTEETGEIGYWKSLVSVYRIQFFEKRFQNKSVERSNKEKRKVTLDEAEQPIHTAHKKDVTISAHVNTD